MKNNKKKNEYGIINNHAEKIRNMVLEIDPTLTDFDIFDVLMQHTCFPMGGPDYYMKQLMSFVRLNSRHPGQFCTSCRWLMPYHSKICDRFFDDQSFKKKGR